MGKLTEPDTSAPKTVGRLSSGGKFKFRVPVTTPARTQNTPDSQRG